MCACGQSLHYSDPVMRQMVAELVDALGPDVTVEVPGVGSFRVPRHYIALHGVKAVDLPALAARYGWASEAAWVSTPVSCSHAGHKVRWRTGADDGCDTCGVTW